MRKLDILKDMKRSADLEDRVGAYATSKKILTCHPSSIQLTADAMNGDSRGYLYDLIVFYVDYVYNVVSGNPRAAEMGEAPFAIGVQAEFSPSDEALNMTVLVDSSIIPLVTGREYKNVRHLVQASLPFLAKRKISGRIFFKAI